MKRYRSLNPYLRQRFGCRVYRIPISAGLGCPNRDGGTGKGGCIYCDPTGSGFDACSPDLPIHTQIQRQLERRGPKHPGAKWIGYFQSHTNTYAPVERLRKIYEAVLDFPRIVILDVATRPDQIGEETLDLLEELSGKIEVWLELGLQSANPDTLKIINRGHDIPAFIDGAQRTNARSIPVIAHGILDFPWDSEDDICQMAMLFNTLGVQGVKTHSLYAVEGTELGRMVQAGLKLLPIESFVERCILFLEHLDPRILIHRLVSDPPTRGLITGNWGRPKIQILDMIDKEMERRETCQGKHFQSTDP